MPSPHPRTVQPTYLYMECLIILSLFKEFQISRYGIGMVDYIIWSNCHVFLLSEILPGLSLPENYISRPKDMRLGQWLALANKIWLEVTVSFLNRCSKSHWLALPPLFSLCHKSGISEVGLFLQPIGRIIRKRFTAADPWYRWVTSYFWSRNKFCYCKSI